MRSLLVSPTAHHQLLGGLLLGAAVALCGCEDLSDFDTPPGQAYCGSITLANAYRTGFSPRVQLRLQLDTSLIDEGASPGTISTYDTGSEGDSPQRLLYEAPLRPFEPLAHDPLSELEFGDGRRRNLIYAVSPAEPTAESLLAVLSLRTDDSVEVRLMRPGLEASDPGAVPAGRRQLYGLFVLTRHEDLCGF
jgi:hypothetical protein